MSHDNQDGAKMIDCPALHERRHDKGYPFGERVPKRIRMTRTVWPDWPFRLRPDELPPAPREAIFDAWTNSYGAVAAVFPDGCQLGVKPGEFEVVEWHEVPSAA